MQAGVESWRHRWVAAGMPTIPLPEGRKSAPLCNDWPFRPSNEQWKAVGSDFKGNTAVRMGNGVAVADADSPRAAENLENWLNSLGIKPQSVPTVKTASGTGRHYYLHIGDLPESAGHAYGILAPDIGAGELRYGPSAYVVAPCSKVGDRSYDFIRSYPEAIRKQKRIAWRDLKQIIRETQGRTRPFVASGKDPDIRYKYCSRSEAEAPVVASLILAGWSLADIRRAFQKQKPGHYRDHDAPDWYLDLTHYRILGMLAVRPKRQELAIQCGAWHEYREVLANSDFQTENRAE